MRVLPDLVIKCFVLQNFIASNFLNFWTLYLFLQLSNSTSPQLSNLIPMASPQSFLHPMRHTLNVQFLKTTPFKWLKLSVLREEKVTDSMTMLFVYSP